MEISIIGLGGIGSVLVNTISRFLNSNENLKPITIKLVDGDDYEYKNISRQEFYNYGNKANVKKRELSNRFQNIDYLDFQMFLDENNISEIVTENSIVFVSVDNHKTRRLVSNYAKKLNNVIVISGGNELTDGTFKYLLGKEEKM